MDGQKFDQITKALADVATRRRFIKGIAGGAVGALAGVFGAKRAETAPAEPLCPGGGGPNNKICHCPPGQNGGNCQTTGNGTGHEGAGHEFDCCCLAGGVPNPLCICPTGTTDCCKPAGTTCASTANCCAGLTCCNGVCQANCCIGVTCTALDQCHGVGVCDPATGICSNPVLTGSPCNDGQFCTTGEVCQPDGTCGGGTATDCSALTDQCNLGVCNEETNACEAQPANVGNACNDGLFCTTGEVCQPNGTCGGGTATDCSALTDQCNLGVCNEETNACEAQPVTNGTPCNDGLFCTLTDTCQGGICTGTGSPCSAAACLRCDETTDTCVTTCPVGFECDGNGNCVPLCPRRDFSVFCPSTTGHGFKCCPTDSICDYSGTVVNCRNI